MSYALDGSLLELCTCAWCYCHPGGEADDSDCDGVNVWHITKGMIGDTDVSGLNLAAISTMPGHVLDGRPLAYYVDDTATDRQQQALIDAWSGKLGGPLADFAQLVGDITGVTRVPFAYRIDDEGAVQVGATLLARLADGGAAAGQGGPAADICTTVPGSQAVTAQASQFRIYAPDFNLNVDLQDSKVLRGNFHFEA